MINRKRLSTIFFTLCLTLMVGIHVIGQDTTVVPLIKKSTDKVLIGGKVYYIHLVKEGETLYSIAKAYGVSEDIIANENVDVLYGPLQINQALKIPVETGQKKPTKEVKKNYTLHLVQPGHTLYFLSRKYNVAVDTIVKYNPETASGTLSIDQVIRIPKKSINTLPRSAQNQPKAEYLIHKVQPGETLYSLSKRFNISIDRIMEINPFLKNDGLKAGQELKMHVQKVSKITNALEVDKMKTGIDTSHIDSIDDKRMRVEFRCRGSNPDLFRTYTVAMLLPFQLSKKEELKNALDTISGKTPAEIQGHPVSQRYRKFISENNYFYEFYEGALLALDSLKKLGFKTRFHILDTEKSTWKVKNKIIPELRNINPDVIIGPVYQENLRLISEFSAANRIPFVSPVFGNRWLLETNPYMFQVIPESSEEIKEASDFISGFTNRNILLVHRGDSLFVDNIYDFRDNLFRSVNESTEYDNIFINEVIYNDSLKPNLEKLLRKDMPNLIVIPSPREIYVIPLLTKLNQLAKRYDIQIFGTSQWQQFGNVDDDYFYNLRVHYYTPFYINYGHPHVKAFITKFREWYNHEPVQVTPNGYNFSYLGYDITFYFLNALRIYGTNFPGCIEYYKPKMLMSDYDFKRDDAFSGFSNHSISIIRYNTDFTVGELDIMKKIEPRWDFGRND